MGPASWRAGRRRARPTSHALTRRATLGAAPTPGRAPPQATLPDHWLVRAYAGADMFTLTSGPVRKPLALTLPPAVDHRCRPRSALRRALTIDAALLLDRRFRRGRRPPGMAVDHRPHQARDASPPAPPPAPRRRAWTDPRVIGIDDSADSQPMAPRSCAALLDAQHYTRGIAFMAPGTPTNNTPGVAGRVPARPTPAAPPASPSSAKRHWSARPPSGPRASAVACCLRSARWGWRPDTASRTSPARATDGDDAAAAMNDALWPATFGYFMEQLMTPRFSSADDRGRARHFWVAHVRPGGPLPALRVGARALRAAPRRLARPPRRRRPGVDRRR